MFKTYIRKKVYLLFLSIFLFSMFVLPAQKVSAIGVSPGDVNFDDMVNGQKKEVKVKLMRTDPVGDVYFFVSASGEAAHFIELPQTSYTLPDGQDFVVYTFYINPTGAANGTHLAYVLFSQATGPIQSGQTGSAIQVGVGAKVTFSITDKQIKQYEISDVSVNNTEENVPSIFDFYIKNSGNVEVKPDKIEYKIVDITDSTNIKLGQIVANELKFTQPWERTEHSVSFKDGLPIGKYKVSLDFYDNGEVKRSFTDLDLMVAPRGTLKQNAEFASFKVSGDKFASNDLIKFEADINSNGEIPIEAVLYIEIKSNNKTVDLLKSDKKFIIRGQGANYLMTYRLANAGDYEADAYFEYGIKQTEHKKVNFSVGNFESEKIVNKDLVSNNNNNKIIIFVVIIIVLVVLGATSWFIKKKYFNHSGRKKKVIHKK